MPVTWHRSVAGHTPCSRRIAVSKLLGYLPRLPPSPLRKTPEDGFSEYASTNRRNTTSHPSWLPVDPSNDQTNHSRVALASSKGDIDSMLSQCSWISALEINLMRIPAISGTKEMKSCPIPEEAAETARCPARLRRAT